MTDHTSSPRPGRDVPLRPRTLPPDPRIGNVTRRVVDDEAAPPSAYRAARPDRGRRAATFAARTGAGEGASVVDPPDSGAATTGVARHRLEPVDGTGGGFWHGRRRWFAVAAAVVAIGLVAAAAFAFGRGGANDSGNPASSSSSSAPSASAGTTHAGSTATTGSTVPTYGPAFTVAFAGDNNGDGLSDATMAQGMAQRLGAMTPLLSGADLTVANLETAITQRGTPAPKTFTFRAPATILQGLQSAGIDVASMANNHGMDYGTEGLQDSIAAKHAAAIKVIGIGANDGEAFAPAVVDVKGTKVAVIAATQVLDANLQTLWTATPTQGGLASAKRVDRLVAEVRKAKAAGQVPIVFLHWGTEKMTCPNPQQEALATTLRGAGAAAVIGGHAHRVLSGGYLGDTYVDYGLGNFGFYAASGPAAKTGVLTLTFDKGKVVKDVWSPGVIVNRSPQPLSGAAAASALAQWNALRSCTNLTAGPGASTGTAATSSTTAAP